jgi:hypothetical protein
VKIVIDIEAGTSKGATPDECEFCHFLEDNDNCQYWCRLFNADELIGKGRRDGFRHHLRLPACLAAEERLKGLMEAGERVLCAYQEDLESGTTPKNWEGVIGDMKDALAPLKEVHDEQV